MSEPDIRVGPDVSFSLPLSLSLQLPPSNFPEDYSGMVCLLETLLRLLTMLS